MATLDNQKWSGVGPLMAAKSGPPIPIFVRTNFRVTGPLSRVGPRNLPGKPVG